MSEQEYVSVPVIGSDVIAVDTIIACWSDGCIIEAAVRDGDVRATLRDLASRDISSTLCVYICHTSAREAFRKQISEGSKVSP